MSHDTIVEEVRTVREAYARQFNFDLEAIFRDLQQRQQQSGRTILKASPKRLPTADSAAVRQK